MIGPQTELTPLVTTSSTENTKALVALLETGKFNLDSDPYDYTLARAVANGNNLVIPILIQYGANPARPFPKNALHRVFRDGYHSETFTLLHFIAAGLRYEQSPAMINDLLISNKGLVNAQDSLGRTPLMIASISQGSTMVSPEIINLNRPKVIKALLDNGASILQQDNEGHDSLYYARNRPEILKMLTDELANREAQEKARKKAVYESPDMVRTGTPRGITDIISSYEFSPK